MKYPLFIVGILQLAFIGTASAASCPDGDVSDILDLTPISEYTKEVIRRAEAGLSYADSSSDADLELSILFIPWLDRIVTAMTSLVDTDVRVSREEIDFRQNTPCLFGDLLIIEAEIEKVRCELSSGTVGPDKVNPQKITRLKALLQFLDERHRVLSIGGLDPKYEDKTWHQKQAFDDPSTVWCSIMYAPEGENYICKQLPEEQCWGEGGAATFNTETSCLESLGYSPDDEDQDDAERMCPFHSDYLPPTSYGYGCDKSALQNFSSHTPIREEYDALDKLIEKRNDFINQVYDLKQLTIDLYALTERPVPNLDNFGMAVNGNHKKISGCIDSVQNPVVNATKKQINVLFQKGATFTELRGPFSIGKNEPKIWREFLQQRRGWGNAREHADELKTPGEFASQSEREDAEREDKQLVVHERFFRTIGRAFMEFWNKEQSARESASIGKSFDVPLDTSLEFEEMQRQVQEMAVLATNINQGARSFTRKFAWFLRASCLFRPCSMQLDNVIKIAVQSVCFPYSTGAELPEDFTPKEDIDNSAEIACKAAAKLFCNGGGGEWIRQSGSVDTPDGNVNTPVFKCE